MRVCKAAPPPRVATGAAPARRESGVAAAPPEAAASRLGAAAVAAAASLALLSAVPPAEAKVVTIKLTDVKATTVTCPKGVLASATFDGTGFAPRCVDITADALNPTKDVLPKMDVFGYVCATGGVCERSGGGSEGASDTGRIGYLADIQPGMNKQVSMVNPLNAAWPSMVLTASRESPLYDVQVKGFKATSLPFREQDRPISECDMDKFASGCPCEADPAGDDCF